MTYPYMPVSTGQSAIQEWQGLVAEIMSRAESLLDSINRPLRLWERNELAALVVGTAVGQCVGDSTLSREQALTRDVIFKSLLVWLQTPQEVARDAADQPIMLTPLDLLSKR